MYNSSKPGSGSRGAGYRFWWPVEEGLQPANFHEKAACSVFRRIFAFGRALFSSRSAGFFDLPSSSTKTLHPVRRPTLEESICHAEDNLAHDRKLAA
jgi:hypothetical protein